MKMFRSVLYVTLAAMQHFSLSYAVQRQKTQGGRANSISRALVSSLALTSANAWNFQPNCQLSTRRAMRPVPLRPLRTPVLVQSQDRSLVSDEMDGPQPDGSEVLDVSEGKLQQLSVRWVIAPAGRAEVCVSGQHDTV